MPQVEQRTPEKLNYFQLSHVLENTRKKVGGSKETQERTLARILKIINANQEIAIKLQSQEYQDILEAERLLKGECKLGIVNCIDGRISLLHQFGKTVNSWEVAGSLVDYTFEKDHETRGLIKRPIIDSRRLIGALGEVVNTEDRQLLEIVTAHTGKEHKCGKITSMINDGFFKGEIDKIALEQAEIRREAIENTFNDLLEVEGKPKQDQVAMTAMIDTDHQGLVINFGRENVLSTTNVLMESNLIKKIQDELFGQVGGFGSMQDNFTEVKEFIHYSKNVLAITEYLLTREVNDNESVMGGVSQYIDSNFPLLSQGRDSQKQALMFLIARTIANQYVTGLSSGESFKHPFSDHHEKYISISPNGKPFGRFDISKQSFGSTPRDRIDAHRHLSTKISIIDSHRGDDEEADIVFVSSPVSKEIWELASSATKRDIEDAAIVYFKILVEHPEFSEKIRDGKLVFIPVVIDEITGEVIEIRDYSKFLN